MAEPERGRQASRVGPYLIERRLGTGGMGVVYLGRHQTSGTLAAVKLLRPEHLAEPRLRARMSRELEAARRVPRSCTAPVLDADLDADQPWVATEYIDGPSLEVVLLEQGRLAGAALAAFAAGVAVALRAIHAHGVVHRDLKPSNVLLSPLGPRVIDFGIARIEGEPGTQPTQLTQPGTVVGTPAYMAPEQLRGEPVTAAADVFAWAGLVTCAATGRAPFGTGDGVMHAILFEPPEVGDLAEPLRALVVAALDKDPAGRPSASELVARLSHRPSELTTQVLAAAADGTTVAAARPPGAARRPRVVLAGVVAAVLVAAVLAAVAVLLPEDDPLPLAGRSIVVGAFHGWQEGIAATFLWKLALEEQGAEVEVRFADVAPVYEAVAEGSFDLAFDAWLPATHQVNWDEHGGDLEDLGAWYTGARLTIAVNGDAPIRSLAELAGAAGEFGNRLIGIEAGAGLTRITEQDVIPAYGLAEMQFQVSSTEQMLNELRGALDQGDNVVVTLWEPHWFYDAFEIRNLDDPENALGAPENIHAFARRGFSVDFPLVAEWVAAFTMSNDDLRSLESVMFFDNLATSDEEYEISVRQWLDQQPGYLAGLTAG